jgi:hypothetical protein
LQKSHADLRATPPFDGAPKTAKILLGNEIIGCRLHEDGAQEGRLELSSAAGIPEHFVLAVGTGDERLARVTCRKQGGNGAELWVRFLGSAQLAA